jgi:predicted phosphoribosyltransferase
LQLTRDVVILDAGADEGADAARLTRELRLQNRRVFVMTDVFPEKVLEEIAGKDSLALVSNQTIGIDEVIKRSEDKPTKVNSPGL